MHRYDLENDRYENLKAFADVNRVYERKVVDGKDVEVAVALARCCLCNGQPTRLASEISDG